MSAIAGIIRFDGQSVDRATLERMQALLTPYGKDSQKHVHHGSRAFLRTLLRTTPEDRLDHQPLVHAESGTTLLFDGRIDNRDELAQALGLSTAESALMADSALVLRACLRWDTSTVERLLGDFALACWQAPRHRLWLARDPLGYRPLYWHKQAEFFAFATMPKGLFAIPGITKALNEGSLHDYMCLLPTIGPDSLFKDVFRVEPGHVLVLQDDQVRTHRYHRLDPEREVRLPSDEEYVEALRAHLERAVACRLRAIGPVASHLSSGFDSSTVTAVAARQLAAFDNPLLAYTAIPREGYSLPTSSGLHADEGPGARALAARFPNIEHVLIRSENNSPVDSMREDTESMDRAPRNPCNMVWVNAIRADAARRGVRALLCGTMGNMTISYHGAEYLPTLLKRGQWLTWWRESSGLKRRRGISWRRLIRHSLEPYLPAPLWIALEKRRGRSWNLADYSPIHPDFMARMNTTERAKRARWDLSSRPWADGRRWRIAAISSWDNGDYYAAANAADLELRDPTADLRLIEFCLALPDGQYLRDGHLRWLLLRLMGDVLPPEILQSKTRGLQAADWHEATGNVLPRLHAELSDLMNHRSAGNYLDLEAMKRALEHWPESGWETGEIDSAYRYKLLRGLSLGAFIRYTEDGN